MHTCVGSSSTLSSPVKAPLSSPSSESERTLSLPDNSVSLLSSIEEGVSSLEALECRWTLLESLYPAGLFDSGLFADGVRSSLERSCESLILMLGIRSLDFDETLGLGEGAWTEPLDTRDFERPGGTNGGGRWRRGRSTFLGFLLPVIGWCGGTLMQWLTRISRNCSFSKTERCSKTKRNTDTKNH